MRYSNWLTAPLVALLVAFSFPLLAQDQPARSWDELVKARDAAFDRLREIQSSVEAAEPEEQQKLVAEFQATVQRVTGKILPALEKQLPTALQERSEDPKVLEVGNEIMMFSFSRNQFEKAQRLADMLRQLDPGNAIAVNVAGVARFANHDFAGATAILQDADEQEVLIPDLGGRYLDTAQSYVEYWKTEQAIREREAAATGADALPQVELQTSKGKIVLELFENEAPNTVANFISLVEQEYYDGLQFHRVIPSFMAQGGCPHSREGDPRPAGSGGPGYNIKCESYEPAARRHFSGTLSMAHAGRDTGGSQFFITHLPTPHLDQEIAPTSVHTVFGRVVEGLDVARALEAEDQIAAAKVLRKRDHDYQPETIDE